MGEPEERGRRGAKTISKETAKAVPPVQMKIRAFLAGEGPDFFSRVLPGRHAGSADQWVPFAGASIFSSRMSSMQMRCSWVIGSFATAPIEMLRTACSSVGQFIWKVTA